MVWHSVITVAADLVLGFGLLASLLVAQGLGELCAMRPGCDRSRLSGLMLVQLAMVLRFGAVALALAVGLWRGAVPGGAAGAWAAGGGHVLLGLFSAGALHRGIRRVQEVRPVPAALGIVWGIVVPTLALTTALAAVHGALTAVALWPLGIGAAVLATHGLVLRRAYRGGRP